MNESPKELFIKQEQVAITPEWLDDRAQAVRQNLGRATYHYYRAGVILREVRDATPGGFESWVMGSFPFSPQTAYQYIRAADFLDERVPQDDIPKLTASVSAIAALTKQDVSESVRERMTKRLLEGQRLTVAMVEGAARWAERSERQAEVLENVGERVAGIAGRTDLDPDVIAALDELYYRDFETFEEIEASGVVYDTAGEPIPLDEANRRDVVSYLDHTRFERKMGHLARSGGASISIHDHRPLTNRAAYGGSGMTQKARAAYCGDAVVNAVEFDIGELEGSYDVPVDIIITAYLPNQLMRSSELYVDGYVDGLIQAGILRSADPFQVLSTKARVRFLDGGGVPRLDIDIYPREEQE